MTKQSKAEQFDMLDEQQAPVARGTMRACWDEWSGQYIPLHGSSSKQEFDTDEREPVS